MDFDDSPEQLFLRLLPLIDRAVTWEARCHRLSAADAEDFAQCVKLKFLENDYAVLRMYQGRSSLATYVRSVVSNAFRDFMDKQRGRYRSSAIARQLGPTAVLLEQYLVRDGLTFEEACQLLRANHDVTLTTAELERLAAKLPPRLRRRMEPEEVLNNTAAPESADTAMRDAERAALRRRIWTIINRELGRMSAEDAAILALLYKSGKKVSEIATILRLPQKPLYRRIEALKKRLRKALEAEGIDPNTLRDLLDE